MDFKIGEKVVCIDNSGCPELVLKEIYTIDEIDNDTVLAFGLEEMKIYEPVTGLTYMYYSWRFRKLDYQFGEDICAELSRQFNEESIELINT